jgi:hypothetical protein
MGRGGKRPDAGRKSPLTREQALYVGEFCESLWREVAEKQAFDRYENSPEGRMIRAEQVRAHMIPVKLRQLRRRDTRENLKDIRDSIDELTGVDESGTARRRLTIHLQRPYGVKPQVLREAVAWCKSVFGQTISTSKATECWKVYKRHEKWRENQDSLIST